MFLGCVGIAVAADEEELKVSFSPEVVTNYIHAVIAADRALYTTHIVDPYGQKTHAASRE